MNIYKADSDYVVSGSMELAAETYADVRGTDATSITRFQTNANTIVSSLPVTLTPSFADTAYETAGARIYPADETIYSENDKVVMTAVPPVDTPAITFVEWQDGSGTQLSMEAVYEFNITVDTEVVAVFTGI